MNADPEIGFLFTPLRGTWRLARSLMAHYDIDPDQYPDVAAELGDTIGDELLSLARHELIDRGLLPDPLSAAGA